MKVGDTIIEVDREKGKAELLFSLIFHLRLCMTSVDSNTGKSINQSLSLQKAGSVQAGTRPIWFIFGIVSGA